MAPIVSQIARVCSAIIPGSWRSPALEIALYAGIYLLYLLTRELVFAGDGAALANAERVIGLEQPLGLFREPAW